MLARGRIPLVVGGTGFYLRWYIRGKPKTPPSTAETEAAAQARIEEAWGEAERAAGRELSSGERWEAAAALVEALGDAVSAERVRGEVNNMYRLRRMVDVLLRSGGR